MLRQLLLLFMLSLGAAGALAGTLRAGVSADYPPLVYKQEGRIVGIEADNARAVGGIIGHDITLVDMPFEKLIPALQAGEIDLIMSGMSVTPERSQQVLFTDSYMEVGQMAIMLTDKVAQFGQPWSIFRPGVRVGVEPGTTGAEFAAGELKEAQVKFFDNPEAAFAGLRSDAIDLFIHDAPTSWQLANTAENSDLISLYAPLTHEQLAWAVRKDDQRLADSLNTALRTMKGNGTLRYILNRWIPVTVEVR
ncbi:MAG: transporter substrate-binding domain-containing protein [Halioglobus sp.]